MRNQSNTFTTICDIERNLREIGTVVKRKERDIVSQHGITLPQFSALLLLRDEGDMTIGELSQKMCLACSTMTDLIDRMEKNGLVERIRDQKDRRVICIHLLERGHLIIKRVMDARCQYLVDVLHMLPLEEVLMISEKLSILHKKMETTE